MSNYNKLFPLMALTTIAALENGYSDLGPFKTRYKKPQHKCLRKECNNLTNHNHGYCSAECCKLDRSR
jgi:hypothetical protein